MEPVTVTGFQRNLCQGYNHMGIMFYPCSMHDGITKVKVLLKESDIFHMVSKFLQTSLETIIKHGA